MTSFLLCALLAASTPSSKPPVVVLTTSAGVIKIQLDPEHAPISTANFLHYVKEKHYDGTVFHRVIKSFMLQGGGFDQKLHELGGDQPPIKNEAKNGLKNLPGTVAMARLPFVDSATDQFFINTAPNDFLDHKDDSPNGFGYAVFGKVISGMDVVRRIESVATTNKPSAEGVPLTDVPTTNVIIKTARLAK